MKNRFQQAVAAFVITLSGTALAQSGAGEVTGRVTDSNGQYGFEGARVSLQSLDRVVTADREGRYRFVGVPAGTYTVLVEYLGAEPQTGTVTVSEDQQARLDIRLGASVPMLENVLVIGQAAGQAAALNQQLAADNLQTIVSADAIGQFPDQNSAESLQRVAGLSLARDQGEGRFVIIRGIDPALSSTTINGIRVPGPEGDSRQVNLDVISSDLLESLVVTKAVTSDMDGDAIGGNIELRSATAFDRGNSFNGRVEGSYNELSDQTSPKLAASMTRLFSVGEGSENLGIAASASWFAREFGSDNVETAGFPAIEGPDGEEIRGVEEAEQRDYTIERERLSASLNFDFRASERLDVYWHSLFSSFSDDELQLTNVFAFGEGEVAALDSSSGEFLDAEVEKLNEARKETQQIFSSVIGHRWTLAAGKLDYALGYSFANEDNPDALGATFIGENLDLAYDLSDPEQPLLVALSPGYANADRYTLDEVVLEDSFTEERELSPQINFQRDTRIAGLPGYWKVGAKARLREKEGDVDTEVYDGFGEEDVTLGSFPAFSVDYPLGFWGPATSREAMRSFFNQNRAGFELSADDSAIDSLISDYDVQEDVYAGYGLLRVDRGPLRIIAGVRVEQTSFETTGTQLVVDEENGSGDPEFTRVSASKDYTDVLPNLQLRYELGPRALVRGAYTQTIARPGFEQASPRQQIEIEEDEGEFERNAEVGNPDLDPLRSQNLDLAVEYYPGGIAQMSAGVFYKAIEDFIVISDLAGQPGPYEDFDEAISPVNGDSADLYGLELSYAQQLRQLPSPFDGLLVAANLTLVESEAQLPFRSGEVPLPRQSDTLYNLSLGYEKYGFSGRVAATYRSEYFDEVDELDNPETDRYVDEQLQVDLTASYRVTPNYQVYVNAVNLNDEPFYAYFNDRRYASQYEEYGPTYELGVKASF